MDFSVNAGEVPTGLLGRVISRFNQINVSLRSKMMFAFFVVILMLAILNIIMILEAYQTNLQYQTMISNVTQANNIYGFIKPSIDREMWDIVAGKIDFNDGQQYEIIQQAYDQIETLQENATSDKSRIKLEVIRRTLNTLTGYVDKMGEQIEAGSRVAENELVLEDIRGVSEVVEATVQDYMLFEVEQAEQVHLENQARFNQWIVAYIVLLPVTIIFSFFAAWFISASIYLPIKKLQDLTATITKDDLQALVSPSNVDEITELGISFNIMTSKVRQLLDSKVREQENLKKAELKALQAQINPHFLYNTLDTIVWMAEADKTDEVIEIVRALSSFFRIALSGGKDWISIRQEVEHVRSYLYIQKIRYRDILDYEINVDEDIMEGRILKLTLQPLVENALYHGIKNKRRGGTIALRAKNAGQNLVLIEVTDNGVGFTPYKLAKIEEQLEEDSDVISRTDEGFGLSNVNKRIKLYYGQQYGLTIESKYLEGTKITVAIPLEININENQVEDQDE